MERVQPAQQAEQGVELASLAPFPPAPLVSGLDQFELLVHTARSAPGQEGRDAVAAVHTALASFPPTEAHAKLLLRLLDEGAFNDVLSDDGTPTREVAVETLLSLGYPWALQIHPDELAWYRQLDFLRRRNKWLLLLGVLGLGAVAELFLLRLF
jgi:hypothetical protein